MAIAPELRAILDSIASCGDGLEAEVLAGEGVTLVHYVVPGVLRAFIEVADAPEAGAPTARRGLVPLSVGVGAVDEAMLSGALHVSTSLVLRQVGVQASLLASELARAGPLASAGRSPREPSGAPTSALETLLLWLAGLRGMYSAVCGACGEGLAWDPLLQAFAPPAFRPRLAAASGDRRPAGAGASALYHRTCCPASAAQLCG